MVSAVATEIEFRCARSTHHPLHRQQQQRPQLDKRRSKKRTTDDLLRCLVPLLVTSNCSLEVCWRKRTNVHMRVADDLSHGQAHNPSSCFPHVARTVTPVSINNAMVAFPALWMPS